MLIGVDGGADALLEMGYRPDLIVGDMDSVSDEALSAGAEVVVHAYRDGRAPGLERVESLGVDPIVFPATGTSEDVAMLLADDKGASLIVAVGSHVTLVEFLDKGRAGMASTFLTRLRVGGKLIDAKGVSRLYRSRISTWTAPAADRGWHGRARRGDGVDDGRTELLRPRRFLVARPGVLGDRVTAILHASTEGTDRPVIDFRYHIVSIVAIFMALAVGIVLGSGPLKDDISGFLEDRTEQLAQEKVDLQGDVSALRAEIDANEQFAELAQPVLVENLLTSHVTTVIVLPDVDGDQVDAVGRRRSSAAGGVGRRTCHDRAGVERSGAERDPGTRRRGSRSRRPRRGPLRSWPAQVLAEALLTPGGRAVGEPSLGLHRRARRVRERGVHLRRRRRGDPR